MTVSDCKDNKLLKAIHNKETLQKYNIFKTARGNKQNVYLCRVDK